MKVRSLTVAIALVALVATPALAQNQGAAGPDTPRLEDIFANPADGCVVREVCRLDPPGGLTNPVAFDDMSYEDLLIQRLRDNAEDVCNQMPAVFAGLCFVIYATLEIDIVVARIYQVAAMDAMSRGDYEEAVRLLDLAKVRLDNVASAFVPLLKDELVDLVNEYTRTP